MLKKILLALTLLPALTTTGTAATAGDDGDEVTIAVFSLNDFHGAFVRDDAKEIPGAPAVWATLDSLKRLYPHNITVAAGDNFGGSYFYKATHGALLPEFFNDLGIRLSAIGNHEFDDGQDALATKWRDVPQRPAGWDIDYICANVRGADGRIPAYAAPYAAQTIDLGDGRSVKVGFVGLIASSTPQQVSKSRIAGLTFDGNYPAVVDSVKRLPDYATTVGDADVRLLLTHIGTKMSDDQPAWDDLDEANLLRFNDPTFAGIFTAHSHKQVMGWINSAEYPVLQGKWHGEFISMMTFTIDMKSKFITEVEFRPVRVDANIRLTEGPRRLQEKIDSVLTHTKTAGGTPLGTRLTTARRDLEHSRDDKRRQTAMGSLVCRAYAEAYRRAAGEKNDAIIVGLSHFGSIRSGFVKGNVSVLDVGEALPFSNPLRAYRFTGRQLTDLVNYGRHNKRFGWLQTSWLKVEEDADGNVTALTYEGPDGKHTPIKADTQVTIVADEFIVNGGDGYTPSQFPASQEVKACSLPATTDAFVDYLKTLPEIPEL